METNSNLKNWKIYFYSINEDWDPCFIHKLSFGFCSLCLPKSWDFWAFIAELLFPSQPHIPDQRQQWKIQCQGAPSRCCCAVATVEILLWTYAIAPCRHFKSCRPLQTYIDEFNREEARPQTASEWIVLRASQTSRASQKMSKTWLVEIVCHLDLGVQKISQIPGMGSHK